MRALVTGAAGFIGSTLVDRLLADGHDVVGIDCFTDYYDPSVKRGNLTAALQSARFVLHEEDLLASDLRARLEGIDVVFHQAGQPGVRHSWAEGFGEYEQRNIGATQRLLEAAKDSTIDRFVYASSSSVYGAAERYPTSENDLPAPMSPYGVTKLAAEHLCSLYERNYGVPAVSLRYFTVFGPRQRPDMAMHRLIQSAMTGSEFVMFGDGTQLRDFTYVDDAVTANIAAATSESAVGEVINIGGGSSASMHEVVEAVTAAVGRSPNITFGEPALGDVRRTGADLQRAVRHLNWSSTVGMVEGVALQAASLQPS